jgi:hypothetical protein
MRKLTFMALFAVSALVVSCDNKNASSKINADNLEDANQRDVDNKGKMATISFDKTTYDFGTVNEGDIIETSFKVTNSGTTDLVITDAQATCGCTVPVWPKDAIKPGETGEVQVKFNTSGRPNMQSKSITLTTNTEKGREILIIRGSVTPKAI